ncbi:hypothetical protein ABG957_03660 [Eggerthella lenta]|jgi:hypothetical protein|uniref:hypothetical protein n=1 Tax=Eggerthella lenta TaxID=84112 RepID=UPI00189AAD6A|nr:hypothetical protein [Eggerthella lenta]MDB1805985.1 hypothetical protein [Eggerthella lenta]
MSERVGEFMFGEPGFIGSNSVVEIPPGRLRATRVLSELFVKAHQGDVLVEEGIERFGNYWDSARERLEI